MRASSLTHLVLAGAPGVAEAEDTIVVIEDDVPLQRLLRSLLSSHGFFVREAGTVEAAERVIAAHTPATILLDLGFRDGDGLDLLRRLRAWSDAPVIILSERARERDKVAALDAGADDYVTKPFATRELLARIRTAIRRTRKRRGALAGERILEVGPIRIDRSRHEVTRDGEPVHLTPIEFRLLVLLSLHAGRVVTHTQLTTEVWGPRPRAASHYLRVHMAALRRKLEANPSRPRWLLTEAGVGYRVRDPEDKAGGRAE
jgi:two-component system KDP operon response regulator KdpE